MACHAATHSPLWSRRPHSPSSPPCPPSCCWRPGPRSGWQSQACSTWLSGPCPCVLSKQVLLPSPSRLRPLSCLSSDFRMLNFVICPRWRARAKRRARGSDREQQAPGGQDSPKFHVVEMASGCTAGLSCAGNPAQGGLTGTGEPAQPDQDERQQPGTSAEGANAAAQARTRCWQLSMLWLGGGLHTASPGDFAVGAAQGWVKPTRCSLAGCGFSSVVSWRHNWLLVWPQLQAGHLCMGAWQCHRSWLPCQEGTAISPL